jgi:hypothetical protein
VGGEVLQLNSSRSKRKKEEIRGASPQVIYKLKKMNSPVTRSSRELELAGSSRQVPVQSNQGGGAPCHAALVTGSGEDG